jgi:hypothetical protein
LIFKNPLSIAALSRIDPSVFNTQKIVDPGVPPAIPTKYLYHLPTKGAEPVVPPGGAAGAVAVINKEAVDRPPAAAEGLNISSSGTPLGNQPLTAEPQPIKIGGAEPLAKTESTLYFDTLNALIALVHEPTLNLTPNQAKRLLSLIKKVESAKEAAAAAADKITQTLSYEQRQILKKQKSSSLDETLEDLMSEVLSQLKTKIK